MTEINYIPVEGIVPPEAVAPNPIADEYTKLAALATLGLYGELEGVTQNPAIADGIDWACRIGKARIAILIARAEARPGMFGHTPQLCPEPVPYHQTSPTPAVSSADLPTGEIPQHQIDIELRAPNEPDFSQLTKAQRWKIAMKNAQARRAEDREVIVDDCEQRCIALSCEFPEYSPFERDIIITALHTLMTQPHLPFHGDAQDLLARMTMSRSDTTPSEPTSTQHKLPPDLMKQTGNGLSRIVVGGLLPSTIGDLVQ